MPVRALKTERRPGRAAAGLVQPHGLRRPDPDTLPDGFRYVGRGVERVDVLSLWLLARAEMALKLERAIEELLPILRRRGVSELLDLGRTSTVG